MEILRAIDVAATVARLSSFSGAAKVLRMSAPSVTRVVAELEEELKIRIFNRTTRSVSLTVEGEEFIKKSLLILDEVDGLRSFTQERSATASGRLVISAPMVFGNEIVAPMLPEFLNRHPQVSIDFRISNTFANLVEDQIDVAIRLGESQLPDSSLVSTRVAEHRLHFYASPEYLKRAGTPLDVSDLRNHRCIALITGGWGRSQKIEGPEGFLDYIPTEEFVVDSYRAQLHAALSGFGYTYMHDVVAAKALAAGELVKILPDVGSVRQGIYAVYPHRRFLASRVRVFIDFLKSTLRQGEFSPS